MPLVTRFLAVLAVTVVAAPAAQAAFPGRNGPIAYSFRTATGDSGPVFDEFGLASRVLGRQARTLVSCRTRDGEPIGPDCTVREFRSASSSADGRRLVFDGGARLATFTEGQRGVVALLPETTADDGDPVYAPGGRRIAFTGANDRGTRDLYVYNPRTASARLIVSDAEAPAWSWRNEIAYVRDGTIYVTDPRGRNRRFVTSGVSPDWSPGGGRLVFIRPLPNATLETETGRIFTIGARGRGLRRVFRRVRDASSPVWSPNGRWLAFERFDAGIFAKRRGVSGPARQVAISQVSGESGVNVAFNPAWRPLSPAP